MEIEIMFILTTTSDRPEPEYTLHRVILSEPSHGEQPWNTLVGFLSR